MKQIDLKKTMENAPSFFDRKYLGKKTGRPTQTIHNWIHDGKIPKAASTLIEDLCKQDSVKVFYKD